MGTVGLNFGSATSGTGFDVKASVSAILAIETSVETPWKTQLSKLQAQDTALSAIGTGLAVFSTTLRALTSFDGVLASKRGASSDTSVLSLTAAGSSAVAGSHSIQVSALAQTSSQFTDQLATASDQLSGSISLQVGSGASKTLTLDASSNTLATLAQTINAGAYGVTANVITDTNGSRLSLVSNSSGAGGGITLSSSLNDATNSTAVGFYVGQAGVDAQLKVDGVATTSASNTVTGAIPGVTFQLLSVPPAGTSLQVQITNDNASVETAVQALVTAYNSVATSLKTQESKDSSGKIAPLFGDPTLALLQNQLSAGLLGGGASGSISSFTQLGLSLGQDGTLKLDVSALDSALNAKFSDLTGFFQNVGSFGQTLTTTLDQLGSASSKGAVYLALQQNTAQEAGLNANVAAQEARAAVDNVRLSNELNLANQILQSIPRQLSEIDQVYSAISGYNSNSGG